MALKIYFAGSIRGGREDAALYTKIVTLLQNYGTVLTEHVGGSETRIEEEKKKDPKFIHDRDVNWLKECDVLVAEVTQPSLGVGYEIGRAIDMNKPILCLFRPDSGRSLSCMIRGAENESTFIVKDYSELEFAAVVTNYMEKFKKRQ